MKDYVICILRFKFNLFFNSPTSDDEQEYSSQKAVDNVSKAVKCNQGFFIDVNSISFVVNIIKLESVQERANWVKERNFKKKIKCRFQKIFFSPIWSHPNQSLKIIHDFNCLQLFFVLKCIFVTFNCIAWRQKRHYFITIMSLAPFQLCILGNEKQTTLYNNWKMCW